MPGYDPDKHHRRSIRLKGYDYSQPGAYFVTSCVQNGEPLFGEVVSKEMILSVWGEIVAICWEGIPGHFSNVDVDAFVVMPNHIHGIIIITPPQGAETAPLPPAVAAPGVETASLRRPTLGQIVAYFKYQSTKQINQQRGIPGARLWQRNYYEHIVRSERALDAVRQYIYDNPLRWELDRYNPSATGRDPEAADLWKLLQKEAPRSPDE